MGFRLRRAADRLPRVLRTPSVNSGTEIPRRLKPAQACPARSLIGGVLPALHRSGGAMSRLKVCGAQALTGKLGNFNEPRKAGASALRPRDFRPYPGRPGACRKEALHRIDCFGRYRHGHQPVSAIERRQALASFPAPAGRQADRRNGQRNRRPTGRRGRAGPCRHAGARRCEPCASAASRFSICSFRLRR